MTKRRNNRTAGHSFERDIAELFRTIGFTHCKTSRQCSRELDNQKVDLVNTDPFYVQCKYTQTINAHTVLSEMPKREQMNILLHKRKNKGTVVSLSLEDFQKILKESNIKPQDYAKY